MSLRRRAQYTLLDSAGVPEPPDNEEVSIEGSLGHVVFRNPESWFTIARLELPDRAVPVTIKGVLPGISKGERLRVHGGGLPGRGGPGAALGAFGSEGEQAR